MKRTSLILLACALACQPAGLSGQKAFKGQVINDFSEEPVSGVAVTLFGISQHTSSSGRFELNVADFYAPGKEVEISLYHPDYGMNTIRHTFSSDLSGTATFRIKMDPRVGFVGIVKDRATGKAISGIKASLSSGALREGIASPVTETDEFGAFRLMAPKRAFVEEVKYGRLLFHDPGGRYKDRQEVINLGDLHTIEMEKGASPPKRLSVGGLTEASFDAREGSLVSIKANGSIRVGFFVGSSGPEGREAGLINGSLEFYNIVRPFNHAALMYRLEGESEWRFCGAECGFIAPRSGAQKIFFEINDNKQTDNEGAYDVEISVDY